MLWQGAENLVLVSANTVSGIKASIIANSGVGMKASNIAPKLQ